MAYKPNDNITQPTVSSPHEFIAGIEDSVSRADAQVLLDWFQEVTSFPPVIWGSCIIGCGRYHYVYDSGRSGDSLMTDFYPHKSALSIYIMPGYQDLDNYLQRLFKHNR